MFVCMFDWVNPTKKHDLFELWYMKLLRSEHIRKHVKIYRDHIKRFDGCLTKLWFIQIIAFDVFMNP